VSGLERINHAYMGLKSIPFAWALEISYIFIYINE